MRREEECKKQENRRVQRKHAKNSGRPTPSENRKKAQRAEFRSADHMLSDLCDLSVTSEGSAGPRWSFKPTGSNY